MAERVHLCRVAGNTVLMVKRLNAIALHKKPIPELQSVTRRMESHRVTYHLTQVNASRLNPSQIGWYSVYLPRRDGRLS